MIFILINNRQTGRDAPMNMKLNFLCIHHRSWLEGNPAAARSTCLDSCEKARELIEQGNFFAAARHAGCALEAAQILVGLHRQVPASVSPHYRRAGEMLVRSLQAMGERALALRVEADILAQLSALDFTRTAKPRGPAESRSLNSVTAQWGVGEPGAAEPATVH